MAAVTVQYKYQFSVLQGVNISILIDLCLHIQVHNILTSQLQNLHRTTSVIVVILLKDANNAVVTNIEAGWCMHLTAYSQKYVLLLCA